MIKLENKKAPSFKLNDQNGKTHTLKDYVGQYVILYFYPKDLTPGCTVEAKSFRDLGKEFKALNAQVLGVSADIEKSHKIFCEKHRLTFPLLADVNKETVKKYGVWVQKTMFGKKYFGIQRDTFLIDPQGKIIKHYQKVNPLSNPQEVLHDLKVFSAV